MSACDNESLERPCPHRRISFGARGLHRHRWRGAENTGSPAVTKLTSTGDCNHPQPSS